MQTTVWQKNVWTRAQSVLVDVVVVYAVLGFYASGVMPCFNYLQDTTLSVLAGMALIFTFLG